jgi:hypothetical protein
MGAWILSCVHYNNQGLDRESSGYLSIFPVSYVRIVLILLQSGLWAINICWVLGGLSWSCVPWP